MGVTKVQNGLTLRKGLSWVIKMACSWQWKALKSLEGGCPEEKDILAVGVSFSSCSWVLAPFQKVLSVSPTLLACPHNGASQPTPCNNALCVYPLLGLFL